MNRLQKSHLLAKEPKTWIFRVTPNALKSRTMQYMLSENDHKVEVLFSSV